MSRVNDEHRVARRHDGGRLGAADRLRAAAGGPARPREEASLAGVRPRRAAAVRPEQHPLRHEHPYRRVGARQERPLGAVAARRRSRSCGTSARPPGTTSCTRRGCRRRTSAPACAPMRGAMPVETGVPDRLARADRSSSCASAAWRASRSGSTWPTWSRSRRCSRAGVHVDRRLARDARGAEDQDRRGDRSARPCLRDRRRGLRGDLPDAAPGRARARDRRARAAAPVRDGLGAGRGDQRRLRRPLQPASARLLRPAAAARATRRSST